MKRSSLNKRFSKPNWPLQNRIKTANALAYCGPTDLKDVDLVQAGIGLPVGGMGIPQNLLIPLIDERLRPTLENFLRP